MGLGVRRWVPAAACAEAVVLYQLILASNTQRLELRDMKACKTLQLLILDTNRLNLHTAIPTVAHPVQTAQVQVYKYMVPDCVCCHHKT